MKTHKKQKILPSTSLISILLGKRVWQNGLTDSAQNQLVLLLFKNSLFYLGCDPYIASQSCHPSFSSCSNHHSQKSIMIPSLPLFWPFFTKNHDPIQSGDAGVESPLKISMILPQCHLILFWINAQIMEMQDQLLCDLWGILFMDLLLLFPSKVTSL